MTYKIGIDVGGVLRSRLGIDELQSYLATPPNLHALEVVSWIIEQFGQKNVYIVSKCPEDKESAILSWLDRYGFLADNTFDKANVFFCRERSEKALIVERLHIDYFIDDRAEVLDPMKEFVNRRVQLSIAEPTDETNDTDIINLKSWLEVKEDLHVFSNEI